MNVLERLYDARTLLMNLDLSVDQEAAFDSLLGDAEREIRRREHALQQIASMRLLSHTALDNQMQAIARSAIDERQTEADDRSFEDVVARLERALREIGTLVTPATAYEETVKQVHTLIGGVLGPAEYAAHAETCHDT